jgi:hypothetical protein
MLTPQKLTKQGVRDLNHLKPKKAPVEAAAEGAVAEETPAVPPLATLVDSAAVPVSPPVV